MSEDDLKTLADLIAVNLDDGPLYDPDPRYPDLTPHSVDYIEEMENTARAILESDWLIEHDRQVAEAAEDAAFDAVQGYMRLLRSNADGSKDFKAGVDAVGSKINHMIFEVRWARAHQLDNPCRKTEADE